MKNFSLLAVMFLVVSLFPGGVARADQHDRLLPLLTDLKGWQAQPAQGMSMVSAQMRMINATRIYNQADKNLTVNVMINSGPVVDSDLQESAYDDESMKVQTRKIDGFWVKTTQNKKDGSGEIIVHLDQNKDANGVLIADYAKMSEDEVLRAIKSMDWKKFKKVVSALL